MKNLKKIAQDLIQSNQHSLAYKLLSATDSGHQIIAMLQELLKKEYLQRDLYETYDFLLFGSEAIALQEHLKEHLEEEMEHIRVLQRYLVSMGALPTLDRLPLKDLGSLESLNLKSILELDLKYEREAVENYSKSIAALEGQEEFTALRVDLENILSAESEHTHDLERYLGAYSDIEVLASLDSNEIYYMYADRGSTYTENYAKDDKELKDKIGRWILAGFDHEDDIEIYKIKKEDREDSSAGRRQKGQRVHFNIKIEVELS